MNTISEAMNLKIIESRKSEKQCFFTFEKKQEFFKFFRRLLVNLGFGEEESTYPIYSFGRPSDKHGEPITNKEENIKFYGDRDYFFENGKYRINLLFGQKKIFLIINSNKDQQKAISEKIKSVCHSEK